MALRSSWDGFLKLSLISVPVRAYNAVAASQHQVRFRQVHKGCGNRIRHQKVCPVHGEVTKEEVVSGYEYGKGEYLEIDPAEIKKLRAEDDESINIEVFTAPDAVDPIYLSGRTFYLVPDGPAGQKPFALLQQVMREHDRQALARIVLSGHEELVLIRPEGKLLAMTVLYYEDEIKASAAFETEVGEPAISASEVKLATTLVEASTEDSVDLKRFHDVYSERVSQLVEAKVSGQALPEARKEKRTDVINLMDALRQSLDETQKNKAGRKGATKPAREPAAEPRPPRRRKTG